MSKTPVETSVDAKVSLASHLSKVPFTATDAFTENLIELSSVVILKTGTCARLSDGNTADAKKKKTANRMPPCARLSDMNFLPRDSPITEGRLCSFGRGRKKASIRLSPAWPDIRAVSQFAV